MDVITVTIFYINAQSDNAWQRTLQNHLRRYIDHIVHCSEQVIPPGSTVKDAIEDYARKADLLLLLVSPDLPDIDPTIRKIVVKRQQAGQLRIFPIRLRPVHWDDQDFGGLRQLPSDGKAVTERYGYTDSVFLDSIFKEIAAEILGEVAKILKERYKKLAETYHANGKYKEGLEACKNAISFAQKPDASLYQLQGDLYTQNEQPEEALKAYDRALDLESSQSPALLEKKGRILFTLGRYEPAITTYREALLYTAGNTSLFRNLGEAHYKLQQFDQARAVYKQVIDKINKQVIDQGPENAHLYARMGDTFLETSDAKISLSWYDQAIALQPANDSFYEKKGDALMSIFNYKGALDAYEEAIRYNNKNADYFISKARALEKLGTKQADCAPISFEKAVEAYEQALRLRPEDYIWKEIGDVLFKLHRLGEALSAYEEAIRYESDFGPAYLGKGKVLQQQASDLKKLSHDLEKLSEEAYSKAKHLGFSNEHFSQE